MRPKRTDIVQKLIQAARGRKIASANAAAQLHVLNRKEAVYPPLPCFALNKHHFGHIVSNTCSINNASGSLASASSNPVAPTPSDFHAHLCNKIRRAQNRVILASLYIGVGSDRSKASSDNQEDIRCKEDELLHALNTAALNPNINKIQILLDANRALREVSYTSSKSKQSHSTILGSKKSYSAKAVHSELKPFLHKEDDESSGVFLFPVNNFQLCSVLPSPLGEVAGVFHIKAYIIDNELILSGANLSEEYFTNRLDRYMSFTDGAAGLVDFYADLCDALCKYALRYDGKLHDNTNLSSLFLSGDESRKQKLEASLMQLFNGERLNNYTNENNQREAIKFTVAYAIPTFQMPISFLSRPMRFHSDVETTRNILQTALEHNASLSVRLPSAYLNLTPNLLSVLTAFGGCNKKQTGVDNGSAYILTAGSKSHGFAPKKRTATTQSNGIVSRIKESIPDAFLSLVKQVAESIIKRGGKVLMYERDGWTFHAKGIWITADEHSSSVKRTQQEKIRDPLCLVSTVIGSGNYGARSEDLDVESNLVVIFNDAVSRNEIRESFAIKTMMAEEWNDMCRHSNELVDTSSNAGTESKVMRVVLGFLKKFL